MTKRVNPLLALAGNLILDTIFKREAQQQASYTVPELADVPPVQILKHKDGAVVLILGMRETGKTTAAMRLAEIIDRPTYAVSPEQTPPKWIYELKIEQLADLPPPKSTLLMDDLPAYMSSKDYGDVFVRNVERIIPVCRHKRKMILIFCSQTSGQADKWCMNADLILLKPPDLLFEDTERGAVAKLYKNVIPIFDKMSDTQMRKHIFVLSRTWKGLCRVNLPGL